MSVWLRLCQLPYFVKHITYTPVCLLSSFSYYQENLVLQFVGQFHLPQLQRAYPTCHLVLAHGIEDIAELLNLRWKEFVRGYATEAVELLVVIILHILAHSSQKTVLLACLMHAAAFGIWYHYTLAAFGNGCFRIAHTHAILNPAFFRSSQNLG